MKDVSASEAASGSGQKPYRRLVMSVTPFSARLNTSTPGSSGLIRVHIDGSNMGGVHLPNLSHSSGAKEPELASLSAVIAQAKLDEYLGSLLIAPQRARQGMDTFGWFQTIQSLL